MRGIPSMMMSIARRLPSGPMRGTRGRPRGARDATALRRAMARGGRQHATEWRLTSFARLA